MRNGDDPVIIDVTQEDTIRAAAALVLQQAVQGEISLVNNAGIVLAGPLEYISLDRARAQFDVNVLGMLAATQAFLPLIRQRGGRVVNIGSMNGRLAAPIGGRLCCDQVCIAQYERHLAHGIVALENTRELDRGRSDADAHDEEYATNLARTTGELDPGATTAVWRSLRVNDQRGRQV